MSSLSAIFASLVLAVQATAAPGPANLLPNGGFSGPEPLKGWLTAFPDEAW